MIAVATRMSPIPSPFDRTWRVRRHREHTYASEEGRQTGRSDAGGLVHPEGLPSDNLPQFPQGLITHHVEPPLGSLRVTVQAGGTKSETSLQAIREWLPKMNAICKNIEPIGSMHI